MARIASLASLMKHRQVLDLLKQAEAHRFEQRYPQALQIVNQALRVDPDHPQASALHDVIEATMKRRAEAGR